MASRGVNKVTILGNVGNDPEIRYAPSGDAVVELSIATSEVWKDKNTGQNNEKTEWHRAIFWGKPAEIIDEYVRKGDKIYVDGSLHTKSWEDSDGIKRYQTQIKVQNFQLLGDSGSRGKKDPEPRQSSRDNGRPARDGSRDRRPPPARRSEPNPYDDFDQDIPF